MKDLAPTLDAFAEATGCPVTIWRPSTNGALVADAGRGAAPPPAAVVASGAMARFAGAAGEQLAAPVAGGGGVWLTLGPCAESHPLEAYARFLVPVVAHQLHSTLEVEHAATELAERYEEINLLYTISEILGRTVTLEEAAATILTEISETVGARRASILVHDRVTDTLQVVVAIPTSAVRAAPPIAVDDQSSVSARVFRTQHPQLVESGDAGSDAEREYRRGAMLSVPIMWTAPDGGEPLGVVNLSDRRAGQQFTAGDQKLVAAIATQIGTAIQNTRLVRSSLAQQRLVQEMELAHDLQMKLLPDAAIVAPEARVAARVVPAESVGGDFYHLFRLGADRTGVMIGDVSSHGYRAALIMALAMSATAIHAQSAGEPSDTLAALLASLQPELDSTEMFITTFYGVIDRAKGALHWANAGHPHAFVVTSDGAVERLTAMDPPLGMVAAPPHGTTRPWRTASDLLLLFTDGISDARDRGDVRLGEQRVLDVVREHRAESPDAIVGHVFELLDTHTGDAPRPDDLTLVVVRS